MPKQRPVNGPLRMQLFRLLYGVDDLDIETETRDETHYEPIVDPRSAAMRGERNPSCKLSDEEVRRIVRMYREGRTQAQIAREVGCSRSNVGRITRGERR